MKEKIYFLIYLHIVKKFDFDIFPFHSLFQKFIKKITILSLDGCSQRNLEQLPTPCMMFSLRKLHLSAGYKLHPRGVTLSHTIQSKISRKVSKIDKKRWDFSSKLANIDSNYDSFIHFAIKVNLNNHSISFFSGIFNSKNYSIAFFSGKFNSKIDSKFLIWLDSIQ